MSTVSFSAVHHLPESQYEKNNKECHWIELEEASADYDSFFSLLGLNNPQNTLPRPDLLLLDSDAAPASCVQSQINEQPNPFSLACLEMLKSYGGFFNKPPSSTRVDYNKTNGNHLAALSLNETLVLAGEKYVTQTQRADGFSMFMHPYASALSPLSLHEMRDVELLHLLLAAAEDVSRHQYDLATNLISRCLSTSSCSGNPAQRLAFYFSQALKHRIQRETTGALLNGMTMANQECMTTLSTNPALLACHQRLPFSQVMQFAGIQSIIENVKTANKIHLIDFSIRSGIQWTILMQALAEQQDRPLNLIKITAIGVTDKQKMEECGNRLQSFASSLNLPFAFHLVFLSDLKDFSEDLVHLESDETVAIYSNNVFRTMIGRPDCLDSVVRAIKRMEPKPVVMVLAEVEANHNSPLFISRFVEALFFYGAFFDCFEDCMERNDPCRRTIEGVHFGEGIINIVAAEGEERFTRNVKIDVWRAFFRRFGIVEVQLSESSMYQAKLILKQFEHGRSCNLDTCGKGLIIGWKGTPIHSLTSWKFS